MNESLKQPAMNLFLFLKTLLLCRVLKIFREIQNGADLRLSFFFDANELVVVVAAVTVGKEDKEEIEPE